jgi:hypothetical protein
MELKLYNASAPPPLFFTANFFLSEFINKSEIISSGDSFQL